MSDEVYATPLKEAIRDFWKACRENRQEEAMQCETRIARLREQTTILVLTGDDLCSYDDERIDLAAIQMLLQRGILHECLECEERDDLADVYEGDHREFHVSGDHTDECMGKALHEYNPQVWEEYSTENLCDDCTH